MSGSEALAGSIISGLVASVITVALSQVLIERRERRNRRDDLRLMLYDRIVELIVENEKAVKEAGAAGSIPPIDLLQRRITVGHRLKLLGSRAVLSAYDKYDSLVFRETAIDLQFRPQDPSEVVRARDDLIELMRSDVGEF